MTPNFERICSTCKGTRWLDTPGGDSRLCPDCLPHLPREKTMTDLEFAESRMKCRMALDAINKSDFFRDEYGDVGPRPSNIGELREAWKIVADFADAERKKLDRHNVRPRSKK